MKLFITMVLILHVYKMTPLRLLHLATHFEPNTPTPSSSNKLRPLHSVLLVVIKPRLSEIVADEQYVEFTGLRPRLQSKVVSFTKIIIINICDFSYEFSLVSWSGPDNNISTSPRPGTLVYSQGLVRAIGLFCVRC